LNARFSLLLGLLLSSAASAADPFRVLDRVPPSLAPELRPAAVCDAGLDPIDALRSQ